MGSYYYLVAQLPCLVYEQSPPMSSENFLSLAQSYLKKNDMKLFDCLLLKDCASSDAGDKYSDCDFINNYRDWEYSLRQSLAIQRAIKLNKPAPQQTNFRLDTASVASKAMDESSPLEAELVLDKARWYAIDSFAGNDIFNRKYLYSYYLKLLLIERREAFNVEKGFSEYKSLYASILDLHNKSKGVEESQGEHT